MNLALVVGGAATEEIAIADGGFEGRSGPEIERLGGLHVVVAVEKDRGFAGSFERFRVDEGVKICRDDFNRFKSRSAEIVRDPAGAALDVRLVFALGADAGNAQEFAKLRQVLVAATFDKFSKVHKGPSGLRVLSKYDYAKLEANVAAAKRMDQRRMTRDRQTLFYDCRDAEYKRTGADV